MGSGGDHLRMKLKDDGMVWDGVGFGLGNYRNETSSLIDIVYNLETDHWRGKENLRLNILDFGASK
jgi:single-stranded-DNA-specific exonuclease